jgi:cyclophilin family peptidyl-prolyl cis-trans isomerase
MPNNLKKKQALQEARTQAAQQEKTIRIIGIAAIALIVIAAIWMMIPKPKSKPDLTIDVNKQYFATVKMAKGGEFVIQLFPDKAPITVDNFVKLARAGFYDGTTFHRVLEGFMAQGGDPTGTGTGGPGYEFEDEFSDLTFDKPGVVAMANSGPNTNGSQFFITFAPTDWLNGKHTIFGQVIEGMDVVNGLTLRDPAQNPSFEGDAIASITITEK